MEPEKSVSAERLLSSQMHQNIAHTSVALWPARCEALDGCRAVVTLTYLLDTFTQSGIQFTDWGQTVPRAIGVKGSI